MHFKALSSQKLPKAQLTADHAAAKVIGRLALGEQCLYTKRVFSTAYLPYSQIRRAWLRQEKIPGGNVEFYQFYLIAEDFAGDLHWCAVPSHKAGMTALSQMETHNPKLKLGYQEQE